MSSVTTVITITVIRIVTFISPHLSPLSQSLFSLFRPTVTTTFYFSDVRDPPTLMFTGILTHLTSLSVCAFPSAHPSLHNPSWITHSDLVSDVTSCRKPSHTSSYLGKGPSSGSQSILVFYLFLFLRRTQLTVALIFSCHITYHQALLIVFTCHCPLLHNKLLNNGYVSLWFTPSLELEEEMTKMDILRNRICISTVFSSRYYTRSTLKGNS